MNRLLLVALILSITNSFQAQKIANKKDVEVEIVLEQGVLCGSLLVPKGKSPKPVVLLIPGSGPTDRNCNSSIGLRSNSFLHLAEELYEEGIATLRIDKRVSGKSVETFKNSLDSIQFYDFMTDAMEWIQFLKKDERFSKVIVAGHSQGSLVGMLAVSNYPVDGFISLAGAGRPIDQILYDQLKSSYSYPSESDTLKMFLDSLRMGSYFEEAPKQLKQSFPQKLSTFLFDWMGVNPAVKIKLVKCPVAIIQGGNDLQVKEEEAKILFAKRPDAVYKVFPEMNHVLKNSSADPFENYKTYNQPDLEITPGLSLFIAEFIKGL